MTATTVQHLSPCGGSSPGLPSVARSVPRERRMVPVRGYEKWCSAENVEFVGIAA